MAETGIAFVPSAPPRPTGVKRAAQVVMTIACPSILAGNFSARVGPCVRAFLARTASRHVPPSTWVLLHLHPVGETPFKGFDRAGSDQRKDCGAVGW